MNPIERITLESINIEELTISILKAGLAEKLASDFDINKKDLLKKAKEWFGEQKQQQSDKPIKRKRNRPGAGRPKSKTSISVLRSIVINLNDGKGPSNYTKWTNIELAHFIIKKLAERKSKKPPFGYKEWSIEECGDYIYKKYSMVNSN